jgi:hypothetical protein
MTLYFRLLSVLVLSTAALMPARAQSPDGASSNKPAVSEGAPPVLPAQNPPDAASTPPPEKQDKRVFGVFPNYRTTDGNVPFQPITSRQKLLIGLKDSFDWPVYPVAGAFAALYQLEDQNPSFKQGMKGYARRYGTALADQVIGNMMTESFMPSLLHQDPRYFRIGKRRGGKLYRAGYAASRIFVSRTDSGGQQFNLGMAGERHGCRYIKRLLSGYAHGGQQYRKAGDCLRHGRLLAGNEGILAGCETLSLPPARTRSAAAAERIAPGYALSRDGRAAAWPLLSRGQTGIDLVPDSSSPYAKPYRGGTPRWSKT